MSNKENNEEIKKKGRPRGKPFPPQNYRGKSRSENGEKKDPGLPSLKDPCDIPREEKRIEGNRDKNTEEITLGEILSEDFSTSGIEKEENILVAVEKLAFFSGQNKLEIVLSKRNNRLYRLQVFLNENIEIRNSTYTGSSMAYNYWNLLKSSLKKG